VCRDHTQSEESRTRRTDRHSMKRCQSIASLESVSVSRSKRRLQPLSSCQREPSDVGRLQTHYTAGQGGCQSSAGVLSARRAPTPVVLLVVLAQSTTRVRPSGHYWLPARVLFYCHVSVRYNLHQKHPSVPPPQRSVSDTRYYLL